MIITAAGPTNDPVELAGKILRKKGTVVIVGAVKMDIPRDPDFYQKELQLKMSCSYGPGRYDVSYEEGGIDYPYGYVRWTEQRNMEAFLRLIAHQSIDLKPLTTHTFDINDAVRAYDLILGNVKEDFVGIVLSYLSETAAKKTEVQVNTHPVETINAGFIGAGSFAQSYLLPNAKPFGSLDTVVTRNGMNAKNVAQKFGFNKASSDPADILTDKDINTVFIATQHDTHARYVIESLKQGKKVFVEKPLALNSEELDNVIKVYESLDSPALLVGFNRRFAEVCIKTREEFRNIGEPLVMNFRVNAGFIPKDHWTQTKAGGGRIVGEICHFIDLMQFFTGSEPVKVFAECIDTESEKIKNDDNIVINIKFSDGSVGSLVYTANGDKALAKEYFEVFGGNSVMIIDDFKQGILYRNNQKKVIKNTGKGHKQEIETFMKVVATGEAMPISFRSICLTTVTTFKIQESLTTGLPQEIKL